MTQKLLNPIPYIVLIATLTVFLIGSGSLNSADTLRRLQVTRSLWTNAPQVLENDQNAKGFSAIGKDGNRYVTWGMGQSLVMLPADIFAHNLTKALNLQKGNSDKLINGIVSYLTFPLINILAIVASFNLLKNLDFNIKQAAFGTLSLLFCTSFLHYSQIHQENSLDFLMTTSGYLLHLLWLASNSILFLWLGLSALGFNLLIRLPLAINSISVAIFTGVQIYLQSKLATYDLNHTKKSIIKYLTVAAIVYGFFLGIDRFYHWMRFDTFSGSYTSIWAEQMKSNNPNLPNSFPFSVPFIEGFLGFLFSPERSIFLFNPLILVTLYISIKNWKDISYKVRAFLLSLIFLLLVTITTYSTWFLWGGAGSWGSRYTTTASQLISLIAIPLAMKFSLKNVIEKFVFKVIILVSLLIQLSSVLFDFNLELTQKDVSSQFTVVQRFLNAVAIFTGNFDNWGLRPSSVPANESQRFITIMFFPWKNASGLLPAHLTIVIQFAWIVCLIILIYLIWVLLKKVSVIQD
ncbi:hypothetical protein [Pseudanabaena mucicola]|uniref:Uncharacterized protein n=1 Tax=Pseudanabaena mucicola FACHB-723 TaxID=2692860 RepID=A0ABR7ZW79_9CYAN|nr:hypothetical protein [Pseudanabaena mucicola]MBD2188226.1 hypothetical protein [Pseudanabaena mucicola FACHB-723]